MPCRLAAFLLGLAGFSPSLQAQVEFGPPDRYDLGTVTDVTALRYQGRPGLAVTETDERRVVILTADPSGALTPARTLETVEAFSLIATGDVNGDDLPDLVVSSPRARALLQKPDASFSRFPPIGPGNARSDLLLADLDGDGLDDIVRSEESGGGASIRVSRGNGTFESPRWIPGGGPLAVGDLFVNGLPDVVNGALALFNQGDLQFLRGDLDVGRLPLDVAVEDMDRDGFLDVVASANAACDLTIFYGNGFGLFDEPSVPFERGCTDWVDVPDLDADGLPDLVTSVRRGFAVRLNDGHRGFYPEQVFETERDPAHILSTDLDEDGLPDIVWIDRGILHVRLNRTRVSRIRSLRGTVNEGLGQREDVLLVNGLSGSFLERETTVARDELFWIRMHPPGSLAPDDVAPFVLYAWAGRPRAEDVRTLPFGMGLSAMPMPISGPSPRLGAIWNNTGRHTRALGVPTHGSRPAPSVPFATPAGPGVVATFYLQGLIFDPGSAASVPASVTNGIVVHSR